MIGYHAQTVGIEIGQRKVTDFACLLQVCEIFERIDVVLVLVIPPMELEQVETFHTHSRERNADRFVDNASGHPARRRNPFGERLDLGNPFGPATGGELTSEASDEVLSRAVMVGEVPSGKSGVVIREHLLYRAGGLDIAVRARDLPHPVQKAADREIRGELEPARIG